MENQELRQIAVIKKNKFLRLIFVVFLISIIASALFFITKEKSLPSFKKVDSRIEKFSSKEEFKGYLTTNKERGNFFGSLPGLGTNVPSQTFEERKDVVDRVSETNVQVPGIDEPDIVKTDGKTIFLSSNFPEFYPLQTDVRALSPEDSVIVDRFDPGEPRFSETKVVDAFPPNEVEKIAKIDKTGDLLLVDNILVIFSGINIFGYDVSDPKNPTQKWKLDFESNSQISSARLYDNKIYLITTTLINSVDPCPITPLSGTFGKLVLECRDIYHPIRSIPVDVTYTVSTLSTQSGQIEKKTSFVGTWGTSLVYMSPRAIYITYTYLGSYVDFLYTFFTEEGKDLYPESVIDDIKNLRQYKISENAKLVELQVILDKYINSLSDDERLRVENEFTNAMLDFSKKHMRDLQKSGIVKIDVADLEVVGTGSVPGVPLNQFSLDEYQDHLRIATTVTSTGFLGGAESVNDVYILNNDLSIVGSVIDLGVGERIFSARFIEDKGYIVTFKQIDPFYVLDLSNPKNPSRKGELKIPGFSSYLHPITKDKILGVGQEGSEVKISLFDVTSGENPTEVGKYLLNEFWSEIQQTHHAFLLDSRFSIFFLPGGKGGYIFSYKADKLSLVKAVSDIAARRAIYINDYMYIIGDNKIVVLDENNWQVVIKTEF